MCRPVSQPGFSDEEPDAPEPADREEPDPPCQPASQSDSTNWDDRPAPKLADGEPEAPPGNPKPADREEPDPPCQPASEASPADGEPDAPPGNPAPHAADGVGFQEACRPVPGPGSAGSGDRGSSLWLGRRYWPALGPEAGLAYEAATSGAEDSYTAELARRLIRESGVGRGRAPRSGTSPSTAPGSRVCDLNHLLRPTGRFLELDVERSGPRPSWDPR